MLCSARVLVEITAEPLKCKLCQLQRDSYHKRAKTPQINRPWDDGEALHYHVAF